MGMNLYFFGDFETTLCPLHFNSSLNFIKSTPLCLIKGREVAIEHWGRNIVEYLSLLLVCCYQLFSTAGLTRYTSDIPFLVNLSVETFLVILYVYCHIQFQLCLGLPHPISAQLSFVPGFFSQVTAPCFHCLGICFFHFSLTNIFLPSNTDLSLSLPSFLLLRIGNSCALWNTSLEICYLYNNKYLVTYKWHS